MLPVSSEEKLYLTKRDNRSFSTKISINGVDIEEGVGKVTIKKGASTGSIQPASTYATSFSASITYEGTIKKNDKIEFFTACPKSGDDTYYKECTVYAREVKEKSKTLTIDGIGTIGSKTDRIYGKASCATVNDFISDFKTATGYDIILENGMDGTIALNTEADLTKKTYRELLGNIAGLYFGYATEDVDGNVVIKTFSDEGETTEIDESHIFGEAEEYEPVTIQAVEITTTIDGQRVSFVYPSDAEAVNCSLNNPLMTEEIFNKYVGNFVGFTYTPHNTEFLGDFSLEPFDTITVKEKKYCLLELTHEYDGGLTTKASAPTTDGVEELTRGETEMNSDIAFDSIGFAVPSIDIPTIEPDPSRYKLASTITSPTLSKFNAYIKDGYMGVLEMNSGGGSSFPKFIDEARSLSIREEFLPAYPVCIFVSGYTKTTNGWISYPTAEQIIILPELNSNGYVKMIIASAYIDPKCWDNSWDRYYFSDAKNSLSQYCHFQFRVQYLLKSALDKWNAEHPKEEEATE